jgi:DNA-binding XRE family transcriptional regulator
MPKPSKKAHSEALQLVDQLILAAPDQDTRDLARSMRARILVPMKAVLERMPGETIAEKSRKLQVSRTTYYAWAEGRARPRRGLAEELAKMTGLTWQEIAGYPEGWA